MSVVALNRPRARRVDRRCAPTLTVLKAGCQWLQAADADTDALLSHRGIFHEGFTFTPGVRPLDATESTTSVITVWPEAFAGEQRLTRSQVDAVEAAISSVGLVVSMTWGSQSDPGEPEVTWDWFSFGIEGASASLVAAVDRYRGGCPSHCSAVACAHPKLWMLLVLERLRTTAAAAVAQR